MIHLASGQILSLYPRSDLAKDAGIPTGPAQSGEFSLGQIVATRDEVDALLAKAEAAGAPVTEVHDRPWGIYSGYFRDPDGHLWEVIHNQNRAETSRDSAVRSGRSGRGLPQQHSLGHFGSRNVGERPS